MGGLVGAGHREGGCSGVEPGDPPFFFNSPVQDMEGGTLNPSQTPPGAVHNADGGCGSPRRVVPGGSEHTGMPAGWGLRRWPSPMLSARETSSGPKSSKVQMTSMAHARTRARTYVRTYVRSSKHFQTANQFKAVNCYRQEPPTSCRYVCLVILVCL